MPVSLFSGNKSDEEDEDEDELLHLEEDSDTEGPCDEDIGPVLQVTPLFIYILYSTCSFKTTAEFLL